MDRYKCTWISRLVSIHHQFGVCFRRDPDSLELKCKIAERKKAVKKANKQSVVSGSKNIIRRVDIERTKYQNVYPSDLD